VGPRDEHDDAADVAHHRSGRGRIPALTAAAQARAATDGSRAIGSLGTGGRGANDPEDRSPWERCITQGSPRLAAGAYNANIQIFQTPDHVVILPEQIHEARIISLVSRPHVPSPLQLWLGDSRRRWDARRWSSRRPTSAPTRISAGRPTA
jgi:hypothetical protein